MASTSPASGGSSDFHLPHRNLALPEFANGVGSGMDATVVSTDAPLPGDVPTLQAMVRDLLAKNQQLEARIAELTAKLDAALKHRFGRRSERRRSPPVPAAQKLPRRRDEHGRSPLPEHLERREVVHDLTDAEKLCPCCGRSRECIGEQTAEQLDLEPVKFFVRRTIKKSYACRHCDPAKVPVEQRLQTAGPAQVGPIPKGLCGPGLLAHAITAKFADHVPVHRLAAQLCRSGVTIARSTLGDWLFQASELLTPLYQLMHRRLLLSRVIHGDDTGVKLRVNGSQRTKKAHLWVGIGDADYPYVVFDFTADYTGDGPARFLDGYAGYFQADALAQYEGLYGDDKVKHVCCVAHARRKFVAASEAGDIHAAKALEFIGRLYTIERKLPPLLAPSDDPAMPEQRRVREEQRRAMRQCEAEPVWQELENWLKETRPSTLPKSLLGGAIGYALNNGAALKRYLEAGYLAIDNNLSERTLRAIALGRNNWGVIGSEVGGKTAAVMYSVVGTCKHLGLDPQCYLREALPGLFALGDNPTTEQLLDWLPDRWLWNRTPDTPIPTATAG
jgi:transposase